jgi:quercetin dioxygenase-like cupin family protein
MEMTRLYTGDDGLTHIEKMNLETHPALGQMQKATGVVFRSSEPGHFMDWHNAPRRQLVITLAGEGEIGLADGTLVRFGAGHVTLAEDLTGKGHTTRVVGNVPRVTAVVPLD